MIIPGIDLIEGNVVRLYQGDYAQKTEYALDPCEVARQYAAQGARWLHIVDLTGAKDPQRRQFSLIAQMVAEPLMNYQAGGTIRSMEQVSQLLALGVKRVVIGSLAAKQPALVKQWILQYGADAIVLALDINIDTEGNKWIATHGWQQNSGVKLEPLLDEYLEVGAKHVLCTDISKDGTLAGTNVQLYTELARQYPSIAWQASGGIGSLDDIRALQPSGAAGIIMGRSLLEGKFSLEEAIACWPNA